MASTSRALLPRSRVLFPEEDVEKENAADGENANGERGRKRGREMVDWGAQETKLQKLLATWFYKQGLPFQAVMDPGLQEFLDALVGAVRSGLPAFVSPTMKAFRGSLLDDVHRETVEKVSAAITDANKEWRPLSLALDVHEHVVNFRIVDAANKQSYFCRSYNTTNPISEELCNLASDVLQDLQERFSDEEELVVRSIILNKVPKNCYEMMEEEDFKWSIPCQYEAMNLILATWCDLRFIESYMELAVSIVAFIRKHTRLLKLYREKNSTRDCKKELILPSNTRLSKNYLVLARLLEVRETIVEVFKDAAYKSWLSKRDLKLRELGSYIEDAVLGTVFWEKVQAIKELLRPLFLAIALFSETFPSIGYVWQAWELLKKTTKEVTGFSEQQRQILQRILSDREYDFFHSCTLFGAAHALNPMVQLGQVPERAMAEFRHVAGRFYTYNSADHAACLRQFDDYLFQRGVFHHGGEADNQLSSSDPDLYKLWISLEVLDTGAPLLRDLACEVMGMSASNPAAEGDFSGVETAERKSLTEERFRMLVSVYEINRHSKRSHEEELRRSKAAELAACELFGGSAGEDGNFWDEADDYSDEDGEISSGR